MSLKSVTLASALMAALALPAVAQTSQSAPTKPTPSMPTHSSMTPAMKGMESSHNSMSQHGTATMVDINTASASELDALPGIGKSRADAIIKNRPYKGKDDLLSRHIVPPNVYNGIKDKIVARKG